MKLNGSAEEIKKRFLAQIEIGKEEFLSGKPEQRGGDFGKVVDELERQYQNWHNKNLTLIKASFAEPNDILSEYRPKKVGMVVADWMNPGRDVLGEYDELKEKVQDRISALEGIIDKLDLFEERPIFRASGAKLDGLHPEVIMASGKLMKDGHFSQAVFESYKALEIYVTKASGKTGIVGADLMQQVFSQKAPVIEISKHPEEQVGFMMLFAGAMKAIRNNHGHQKVNLAEQEALEWLTFSSALFRLIDKTMNP